MPLSTIKLEPRPTLRRRLGTLLTYKRILCVLLIPLGLLLTRLAVAFPTATEAYARGPYRWMRGLFGRLTSLVPLSVAELLLFAALAVAVGALVRWGMRRARRVPPVRREHPVLRPASTLLCALGVLYGVFVLTCGVNYHRISFAGQSGLTVRESSTQELAALYSELAAETSRLRELVPEDENGLMSLEESFWSLAKRAPASYQRLSGQYPALGGYTPRPKPVLLSRLMSWCGITGIYLPHTFEANINVDVPDYNIPSTLCHELAHSKGFMREDEANFLAFLACRELEEDPRFAYSGYMLALSHTGSALRRADPDLYRELSEELSEGVWRDRVAGSAYWAQFEGPVTEVATAMNNSYLRSNRQEDGVASYGRMVDLLLADYRDRHGLD